jgi:hypothetical protein
MTIWEPSIAGVQVMTTGPFEGVDVDDGEVLAVDVVATFEVALGVEVDVVVEVVVVLVLVLGAAAVVVVAVVLVDSGTTELVVVEPRAETSIVTAKAG